MDKRLFQDWLALQCQMIPGVDVGVVCLGASQSDGLHTAATWPKTAAISKSLLASARRALSRREALIAPAPPEPANGKAVGIHIAYPLIRDGAHFGALAMHTGPLSEPQRQAVVQLLSWGSAWLELLIGYEISGSESAASVLVNILQRTHKYQGFPPYATAIAGELARSLQCRRVSIGLLERGLVRIRAISNSANYDPKAKLIRRTAAAMDECLAQGITLAVPQPMDSATQIGRTHEALAQDESLALCSLMLNGAKGPFGCVTLERDRRRPFVSESIDLAETLVAVLGPLLEIRLREARPMGTRLWEALTTPVKRLFGPGHLRLKLLAGGFCLLLAFLVLGTGMYRVSAKATLEGRVQRAVVAPFDGFIAASQVRAGEEVKLGQVLVELDDQDLRLEQRKWAGQRDELEREHRKALADLAHSRVRILRAQMAQAETRVQLTQDRLARSRLLAPFDGVLISGDLSRSLGAPVERGEVLFEVAPLDDYRVALEVEEQDMPELAPGQAGELTLSALPGEPIALVLDSISGIARTDAREVVFRVEASLVRTPRSLRPGMQGVGKIEIGERRLLWIWTRRLWGWLQLQLWSWWP